MDSGLSLAPTCKPAFANTPVWNCLMSKRAKKVSSIDRKNVCLSEDQERRAYEIKKVRGLNGKGLTDLVRTLILEEYDRRFPINSEGGSGHKALPRWRKHPPDAG